MCNAAAGAAAAAAAAKSLQSCPTLCDPIDSSLSGSPVPGILQARTLEWVAISLQCMKGKVKVKSCSSVWLSNPLDCSLPGSSVHGIFQARVLEWVAIAFSKCVKLYGSIHVPISLTLNPLEHYPFTPPRHQPLVTTNIFTVSIVFPFAECYICEII